MNGRASLPGRALRFAGRRLLGLGLCLARRLTLFPRIGNVNHYAPRRLTECPDPAPLDPEVAWPTISIVTPSFNQGAFIDRTITSVVRQGYPSLEYFVQDGGSTDETIAVLAAREHELSGWRSARDRGQAHAINLGFARTHGEIMAWLNSDDLLLPGALARVAAHFTKHPEIDVVYGNRLLIDEHGMETGRWLLPGHDGEVLSLGDYVPQETLFWRRSIWERAGGRIDESFRFAMDWDLLLRFRDAGARFAHLPCFLGAFRIHALQKTATIMDSVGVEEMTRIRSRIWGRVPTGRELHRALLPFLCRHVLVDVAYRLRTWSAEKLARLRSPRPRRAAWPA